MRRTLLKHIGLWSIFVPAASLAGLASAAHVKGLIPVGSKIEFLATGSPDRHSAQVDAKGSYSLELDPAKYEITVLLQSGKKLTGSAYLKEPEIEINVEADKAGLSTSGQAFDLLADWRVVDAAGRSPGTVKVDLEAELNNGKTEKLTVWALSGSGDDEKESEGLVETTPDGRVLFRAREAAFRPDRIVALRVTVGSTTKRLTPVLEFSAGGHFHAIYPDELTITLK